MIYRLVLKVVAVIIKLIKCFNPDQMHVAEAMLKSERAFLCGVCIFSLSAWFLQLPLKDMSLGHIGNGSVKLTLGVTVSECFHILALRLIADPSPCLSPN